MYFYCTACCMVTKQSIRCPSCGTKHLRKIEINVQFSKDAPEKT